MGDNGMEEDFASLLGHFLVRMGFTQQDLANQIGMHRNTIVKWMNRTSGPTSRGQVLKVADELSLSKQERKALIQSAGFSLEQWPTEIWTVPQQRDMFFTGREMMLQALRESLKPGCTMALTQAISGLGGIGKTHTAVEYAYRFHQDYEAVLWLQADSWEVLVSQCIQLADVLALPAQKESDQMVEAVQRWLRKHHHWLLILDNVENPQEILPTFVPAGHQGCVLVTTRVHNVEPLAQTQVLSTMSEAEGVLFLLRRTTKIAAKAGLEKTSPEQYEEAKQLWHLLDGLPLALDQAGAYILETHCSFSAYQEQYNHQRAAFLLRRGKRFIGHEASVATTFSLSFKRIQILNVMAADILRICSVLYSENIPEEIFYEGAAMLELSLRENGSLDEALGVLQDYSLVQRNTEEKTLSIHRLVQAALIDHLDSSKQQIWVARVICALHHIFPDPVEYAAWPLCERSVLHVQECARYLRHWHVTIPEAALVLNRAGLYLYDRARRDQEAEQLLLQALAIAEKALGSKDRSIAEICNNLGILYRFREQYEQATAFFHRSLTLLEQIPDSPREDIAGLLSNVAVLYRHQGRYEEGEAFLLRAFSIYEQVLPPEDPEIATTLNALALLYFLQEKYDQAEPLYQQALSIREQALGREHLETAVSLSNVAKLYHMQRKYEQAKPLYQEALQIFEKQLGPEHPTTQKARDNYTGLLNQLQQP